MSDDRYFAYYNFLREWIPKERLIRDELRTLTFGTDASFYRLIPKLVVKVEDEKEVLKVLEGSRMLKLPVTFRAAGTSLSGQSISDSVLVMLGSSWTGHMISSDASKITLQPGVVGAMANAYLSPYGRKIGPDPASIASAMIGGIAANNASGMCCGTAQNSYRTLSSLRVILVDGTVLDTADPESRLRFFEQRNDLVKRIRTITETIQKNRALADRIRRKYKMKNTTGYSLNAFVDYEDPIDVIQHLMIGSEGTLGFIAQITYSTVPELADKASALMIFPTIETACRAVEILKQCTVDAVELMDRASLRSVENKAGMPEYLKTFDERVAALLVETRARDRQLLATQIRQITRAVDSLPKAMEVVFTDVASEYTRLWNIRKGLFPSVGAMRATGTTCIIEDVAFPVPRLAEATLALQRLFLKHGYEEAILFGHALEGNLHFVFNQDFNSDREIVRYKNFLDDLTGMVVHDFDGSLKAEHGTGRNMAPFVELEWGADAYALMKEIKNAFDPENLLNPGVILNQDRQAHVSFLKPLPAADPIIDKCIECGFCEVQCPSKNLTLTPRHRIIAYREISRLQREGGDSSRLKDLKKAYEYFGQETCATDGLCSLACPVNIDTGTLVKALRSGSASTTSVMIAGLLADHMATVTRAVRALLNLLSFIQRMIGPRVLEVGSSTIRGMSGGRVPLWNRYMPRAADSVPRETGGRGGDREVVYFPTCINRTFGISRDYTDQDSVMTRTHHLLLKAGYRVVYPENLSGLCCGMAFNSKGFKEDGEKKARELETELLKASRFGELPILVDMSPCLHRMKETLDSRLRLYEPIAFALEFLVDRLDFHKVHETVAVHSTCSSTRMGLGDDLKKLAGMCADRVVVPEGVGCCGWAGDRGFTFPELNASALMNLGKGIPADCRTGYSTSRTCEIGLSLHSGISYKSIMYLIDHCTTASGDTH